MAGTRARCVPVLEQIVSAVNILHAASGVDEDLQHQACGLFLGFQEGEKLQAEIHEASEVDIDFGVELSECFIRWFREVDRVLCSCIQEDTIDVWMFRGGSSQRVSLMSLQTLR